MAYAPPAATVAHFNFNAVGHVPGSTTSFDFTPPAAAEYYQIWTDDTYVYTAISTGLEIYEIESESIYAFIDYTGGFNAVWANDSRVFLGTPDAGIKYLDKTCISGSIITPVDLVDCLGSFSELTYYSTLTAAGIVYLHGYGDVIGSITVSGVDIVKINPQSYRSFTTISGSQRCFMTSDKFYYTFSDRINRLDNLVVDWTIPNASYITGSGIFTAGIEINDIYITENTSSDNTSNTIFAATTSGVYVIDEGTEEYVIYYNE